MIARLLPRRQARGIAAAVALLSLAAAPAPAALAAAPEAPPRAGADEVGHDPAVAAARAALERAGADLEKLTAALDEAAGAYEHANAHAIRLEDELAEADGDAAAARRVVARTEASFEDRIVGAYKRPAAKVELAQAVLAAGGPATAMHRAALLQQLTARGADQLTVVRKAGARTTEAVQQHHIVHAGSAGAAADARRTADALSALIATAREQVALNEQQLASAEDAARARIAEEARRVAAEAAATAAREAAAQDARRTAAAAAAATGAAGPVRTRPSASPVATTMAGPGGAHCPIAGPNGFIDSWGFPRSGGRTHQGTDMFADYGTPLVAVTDGVVRRVWNNRLGGLSVDLVTTQGDRFYYAHLSSATVTAGQRLAAGEQLGAVGDSGNARGTPPHLHWQYHPGDGAPVNPYPLAAALCR